MIEGKAMAGRPSAYKPEYNDLALELLSSGGTIKQLARKIGVARSTLYEWEKENEQFSDTLKLGREFAEAYWEEEVQNMMYNREINAPIVKLVMANRFGWTDKQDIKQDITSGGNPISSPVYKVVK